MAGNSTRGRKSLWTGFKLAFLKRLGSEIAIWRAQGQVGGFYDYAVSKFFATYGFLAEGPFNINPAMDPPEADEEDEAVAGCRTQEEADIHAQRAEQLRDVSRIIIIREVICTDFCFRYLPTGFGITTPSRKSHKQPTAVIDLIFLMLGRLASS